MIDTYNSLFLIFFSFTIIRILTTLMKFPALLTIIEYPRAVVTKHLNYVVTKHLNYLFVSGD